MKWPGARAGSGNIVSRWSDQHIPLEPGEIRNHNARSRARDRIPEHQLGFGQLRLVSYPIGIVAHQLVQAGTGYLGGEVSGVLQPEANLSRNLVAGAAADRV